MNLLLEVAVIGAFVTGVTSWAVGSGWSRWWTAAHAVCGLSLVLLAPAKLRGSVRRGMRRRRRSRWLSASFGVLVLAVVGLGVAHTTGLWYGYGSWSALWTHVLVAFLLVPLFVWHLLSRPTRVRRVDLDRRMLLGSGVVLGAAMVAVAAVEGVSAVVGTPGGRRRFTGSHEVASFDPDAMPTVSWIDDEAPDIDEALWPLTIGGRRVAVDDLRARTHRLDAVLDCTGGWCSTQHWDVVAVADLLGGAEGRSFEVRSATGYTRLFPMADAERTFVAVGYDSRPLRRGHGAPVRIVAPQRRGPWWVKWVVAVTPSSRPWWLQLPFPAT